MNVSSLVKEVYGDICFYYGCETVSFLRLLRAAINPSIVAVVLFRLSAKSSGVLAVLARWALIAIFSSDIAAGAAFNGPIRAPHPLGIVIGKGCTIGARFTIFQNTTIGKSSSGRYPVIGDDVTVYSGAVVFGGVNIASGTSVGANETLSRGKA